MSTDTGAPAAVSAVTGWAVLRDSVAITVAAASIVGALVIALSLTGSTQGAATVLGIVVPGLVTIGAAAFGVVAYSAGTAAGEARGAAGKDEAIQRARRQLREQAAPAVSAAAARGRELTDALLALGSSNPGDNTLLLATTPPSEEPLHLPHETLSELERNLARLEGLLAAR